MFSFFFFFQFHHSISNRKSSQYDDEAPTVQNLNVQQRISNLFVSRSNRIRTIQTQEITRRSTFAVVVQGLHFLRRKAPLHKLDRLARIGFPALFVLCNCIYWYIFVFYK